MDGLDLFEEGHCHPKAGRQDRRRRIRTCCAFLEVHDLLLHDDLLHRDLEVQGGEPEGETGQAVEGREGFLSWGGESLLAVKKKTLLRGCPE